jgi:ElaB/YqjD/DUF883 family membrane-anchored ribosome-binding protein
MPDPLHSSGDIPRFDSYPAPAPEEFASESGVGASLPIGLSPARELPASTMASHERVNPALNQTAEKIGALLGTAVRIVKSMPRQLQAVPQNVSSMGERLREKSGELREDASEAARELRQNAEARLQLAREQARQYAYEKPFHVIAGIAGLAFCVGVALRIWRSSLE